MADSLTIREAGEGDLPLLALVGGATFLEGFANLIAGPDIAAHVARNHSVAAYAAYMAQPAARAWLATTAVGAPVGYALMTEPDVPQTMAGDIELKRIYLFSHWQGSGAAIAMMDRLFAAARAAGRTRLVIGTHHDNDRAIAFYRKLGAIRIGGRRFQVGDSTFDDHVYAVDL